MVQLLSSWAGFFFAVGCAVIVIFLPGALMYMLFGKRISAYLGILAPMSTALYSIIAIAYPLLGITSSLLSMFFGPVILLTALCCAVLVHSRKTSTSTTSQNPRNGLFGAAAYVCFGIFVAFFFFILPLDGPDSYPQLYDNVFHLNDIDTFLKTGNWSSIAPSVYYDSAQNRIPFTVGSGFYPSGWHALVALVCLMSNSSIFASVNAVNFVLIAAAFPLAMHMLMSRLFPEDGAVVLSGAFCTMGFAVVPWSFLYIGPQYPNMAGLILLPGACALFIDLLNSQGRYTGFLSAAAIFIISCVGIVFLHPNTVFTAVVFLAPFCVMKILSIPRLSALGKCLACTGFVLFVGIVWLFFYKASFMKSVLSVYWSATYSFGDAISAVLTASFMSGHGQLLVALLVLLGVFLCLQKKDLAWMPVSFCCFSVLFILAAATDGLIKKVLTGFWYTDEGRLAASAALFAIPLAALGLSKVSSWFYKKMSSICVDSSSAFRRLVFPLSAALAALAVYTPVCDGAANGIIGSNQLGRAIASIADVNEQSEYQMLTQDEIDFIMEASQITGDSLVLNNPYDGSVFARLYCDINIYYRTFGVYGEGATDENVAIRYGLSDIAADPEVEAAVDSIEAEYLLLLDYDSDQGLDTMDTISLYHPDWWPGITSVDDDTPGFSVVLARDDMRLYRID